MFANAIILLLVLGSIPQDETLRLRFIGNAGFEITDGTSTILIDFPYQSGAFGYMTFVPEEIHERPNSLCLFTHVHADHFSPEQIPGIGCTVGGPASVLAQSTSSEQLDGASPWRFGSAAIACVDSEHADVDHCSYVLKWHDRVFVFAGDVESVDPVLGTMAAIDYLILPYWASAEVSAIRGRLPGIQVILSHQEPGQDIAPCSGCLRLGQGESIDL